MNRGLLWKVCRELWPLTVFFGTAALLAEALLAFVVPQITDQFSTQIFQLKFVQAIIRGMLGTDLAPGVGAAAFLTICWVHPVVLSLVWGHAIVCSTRLPAGEVERGTIDILLSLPVSRLETLLAESIAWVVSAASVISLAIAGNLLGGLAAPPGARLGLVSMALVGLNLLCVNGVVAACGYLAASISSRKGRAMTAVFVVVLVSFLINYLAQFWEPAHRVVFLSVLNYYRPLETLRDESSSPAHLATLSLSALALWGIAAFIFCRRDLSTT